VCVRDKVSFTCCFTIPNPNQNKILEMTLRKIYKQKGACQLAKIS